MTIYDDLRNLIDAHMPEAHRQAAGAALSTLEDTTTPKPKPDGTNCNFYTFKNTGKFYTEERGCCGDDWGTLPRPEAAARVVQAHGFKWPGMATDAAGMFRVAVPDDGVPFLIPPEAQTVDDLPYGNAPAPEPTYAVLETGAGKLIGYKLRTDRHGGCLYCCKPLAAEDATCPNCGWDGEYPITKVPVLAHGSILPTAHGLLMGGVDHAAPGTHSESVSPPPEGRIYRIGGGNPNRPASVDPHNTNAHEERMLKWFTYDHLPAPLAAASAPWCELAVLLCHTTPPGPERTVALRKLLEGKDAAVRASLTPGA